METDLLVVLLHRLLDEVLDIGIQAVGCINRPHVGRLDLEEEVELNQTE